MKKMSKNGESWGFEPMNTFVFVFWSSKILDMCFGGCMLLEEVLQVDNTSKCSRMNNTMVFAWFSLSFFVFDTCWPTERLWSHSKCATTPTEAINAMPPPPPPRTPSLSLSLSLSLSQSICQEPSRCPKNRFAEVWITLPFQEFHSFWVKIWVGVF